MNNTVGAIDVKWGQRQEPLTGIARKFYPGDRLVISVTGEYTQHDTRTENHCSWLVICNDVDVPDPHKHSPASDQPAQMLFLYEDNSPVPSLPNPSMLGPSVSVLIPYDKVEEYGKAIKLVAWIPGAPRREISDGLYTLTVQVDSSERLKALEAYLRSGPKREADLRNPDVLNERLCVQHPSEVASLVADHAAKFFSSSANPLSADEYPLLMKLAQSYAPKDSTLFAKLAEYYIGSGDYQGAEKNAMDALRNAKDDDERADAFLRFGEISEQKSGGLETGSLATAASFYAQASENADKTTNRSIQLAALVAQARVLRRTRTIATLRQSAALLERARSLTPISVDGTFSGLTEDGKSALVSKGDNGFYVETLEFGNKKPLGEFPHGGAQGEHWYPLAINGEGNVLVARDGYSLDWWDPASGHLTNVGNANVQFAVTGGSNILAITKSGELLLYLPGRVAKTVTFDKWHDRFPTNPTEIPVGKIIAVAISGDGNRYAYASVVAIGNAANVEMTVENQNAQQVAKLPLDKTQLFHAMALSPDGSQLAAVVSSGWGTPTPPTRNLLLWSVGKNAPAAKAKDSNGKELAFDLMGSNVTTSFSPDGSRVYVASGTKLYVFNLQGWKLDKSIDVNLLTGLPPGQQAEETFTLLPNGKVLLVPLFAPVGTSSDIALYDPATDQLDTKKDYRLTSFFSPVLGMKPLLQTALKDGTILSVRPTFNMTLAQTSLADGTILRSAKYEDALGTFINQGIVANQIFLHTESGKTSTKLVGQDGEGGIAKDLMQNPLFFPIEYGSSDWQMFELGAAPAVAPKSLHVFHGMIETATYAVVAVPQAALAPYQPGGLCAVAPFVGTAVPATWGFFGQSVLAPNYFFFTSPNARHELIDMPVLLLHSNATPSLTTRTAVSCAALNSGSSSKDAALFVVQSVNPAGPDSLVLAEGVPTKQMVTVFGSIARGGKSPFMGGVFSHDGEVFLATYRMNDVKAAVWKFGNSGYSQIACAPCDRANASLLDKFMEDAKITTGFAYPQFALLASSGKRVAVSTGRWIEVQDIDTSQLRLKIPIQVPIGLTDSCAITQDRDGHLFFWTF